MAIEANRLDGATKAAVLVAQRNEATEARIYEKLSRSVKELHNRDVLARIARDEAAHYEFWKRHSGQDVRPRGFRIWWYFVIARAFGLTFGIKLMERGEEGAQVVYGRLAAAIPGAQEIAEDENRHENELIAMIDEEKLKYVGSIVLGLNDALVELTGALAGFTFALRNTQLIAMAGFITGIAASLSMAASQYLSTKAEAGENPTKSSVYTGIAYVFTVLFLIFPYLIFGNLYVCLGMAIIDAIIVIFLFTYYVSVAQDIPFRGRFVEMTAISFGVAVLTFGIGYLVRIFLGVGV